MPTALRRSRLCTRRATTSCPARCSRKQTLLARRWAWTVEINSLSTKARYVTPRSYAPSTGLGTTGRPLTGRTPAPRRAGCRVG